MNYIEFGTEKGTEQKEVILLLHGGGLSWWNYREAAQMLQEKYYVILPILDGHAGSDRDFTTIEENAAEIIAFLEERWKNGILLLGGLSLGGQVVLEILAQRPQICRYALVESAAVIPSQLTYALIKPAFGSCYGLIRRRWFARLQFWSLRIKQTLFEEYFRDTCRITEQNMIVFLRESAGYSLKPSVEQCSAQVHIIVGSKEKRAIRSSAQRIHDRIRGSRQHVLPGKYHGEFSMKYAVDYAEMIIKISGGEKK